ncbi:MAG: galactokinase [Spirochaetaceae bacterium]|nr:galactokinase [Spirochaetaceae bacterium]
METTTNITQLHAQEYDISDNADRVFTAEAPGRIHYLGEHSPKRAGIYLSSSIDRVVRVAVSGRRDNSLRFFTAEGCERKRTTIMNMRYRREDRWANHVKLAICLFAEQGYSIKGMNWTISSSVPQNIGLGAASAIELAAVLALRAYFNSPLSDARLIMELDRLHREFYDDENKLPDYLIMTRAEKDTFLIVDEISGEIRTVKSTLPAHKIILVDSKVPFMGVDDELRIRQEDLARGLEKLSKKRRAKSFKDFIGTDMIEVMGDLNEEIRRRSMHVVNEFTRIEEVAAALEAGDIPAITRLLFHSHESLRDFYEVTCPELDWLVKRAQEVDGVMGARMTGSGFGGCVYVIINPDCTGDYLAKMEEYERIFGFHPAHYEVQSGGHAHLL